IGGGTAGAVIESGKTTALKIPVSIDTSGNDITRFAITSPISAEGVIDHNSTMIDVSVPSGTNVTGMTFTVTHTGASISPAPGTPLDFTSPQTFTVTAENDQQKTYKVTVNLLPDNSVPGGGGMDAASSNDITGFAITSPVSAEGVIVPDSTMIDVSVPFGTNLSGMNFTATHTGASLSPEPGTPLDFTSPQTFTVRAENDQQKIYTVTVNLAAPPVPDGGTTEWPSAATWQDYGLSSGLTQPPGTTVPFAGVSTGTLIVYLQNADTAAFDDLVNQFTVLDGIPTTSSESGYSIYELAYIYGGTGFTLTMTYGNGMLLLSIEPDDPSGFAVWPDNSRWTVFNLSGLTQPAGTTVDDVTESASSALLVTLNNINHAAYEDLLIQITTLLGTPYDSTGSASTPEREDVFISTMGANTLMVMVEMDTVYDEIIITAVKY
ncbi:MAG: DUF5018 domain-containing protein, partial [Spirochaetales bacterium]|nr:DUF5018 domain-containing protein [Spirochaetales bacterium]